jgi:hypothetical protein
LDHRFSLRDHELYFRTIVENPKLAQHVRRFSVDVRTISLKSLGLWEVMQIEAMEQGLDSLHIPGLDVWPYSVEGCLHLVLIHTRKIEEFSIRLGYQVHGNYPHAWLKAIDRAVSPGPSGVGLLHGFENLKSVTLDWLIHVDLLQPFFRLASMRTLAITNPRSSRQPWSIPARSSPIRDLRIGNGAAESAIILLNSCTALQSLNLANNLFVGLEEITVTDQLSIAITNHKESLESLQMDLRYTPGKLVGNLGQLTVLKSSKLDSSLLIPTKTFLENPRLFLDNIPRSLRYIELYVDTRSDLELEALTETMAGAAEPHNRLPRIVFHGHTDHSFCSFLLA